MGYEIDRNAQSDEEPLMGSGLVGGTGPVQGGSGEGSERFRGRNHIDLDPTKAYTIYIAIDNDGGGRQCCCNYALKKLTHATKHFFDYFTIDETIGGIKERHSCDSEIVTVYAVTVYGECLKTIEVYINYIANELDLESIYVVENFVLAGVFRRNCRHRS